MTLIEMELEMELELEKEAHRQRVSGEASEAMEHNEALEMMASERYLLDELTPEVRDAYEEHFFGCQQCALDVQLGAAFLEETKLALPGMIASHAAGRAAADCSDKPSLPVARKIKQKRDWFAWLRPAIMRPAFMAPAFACLLALVGYQNLVVYPGLQAAATEPRILPVATVLHDDTRGVIPVVYADLKFGTAIAVELPSGPAYSSYKLQFYDSKGKLIWTRTAPGETRADDTLSFFLASSVRQDVYKLVISGVTTAGETVQIKQQFYDLQLKK